MRYVGTPDPGKRPKVGDAGAGGGTGASIAQTRGRDPLSFVTWNANSLLGRLRKSHDKDALFEYLRRKDLPDVICVQETWLPAAGPNRYDLGTPQIRSLAPNKSESITALTTTQSFNHRRGTLKDDTKVARDDRALLDLCFRQKPLSAYTPYYACADIKRAGTAVFVKKDLAVRSVSRSLVGALAAKAQHDEGRVLVIEFEHFVLLNTYAQNNGWSPESFAKRRRWDAEVDGEFLFILVWAM
jgi:exonuclease III